MISVHSAECSGSTESGNDVSVVTIGVVTAVGAVAIVSVIVGVTIYMKKRRPNNVL